MNYCRENVTGFPLSCLLLIVKTMEENQLLTPDSSGNQWILMTQIGKGSFGEVWLAKSTRVKGLKVAAKFEKHIIAMPTLNLEWNFYKSLGKHEGIPEIYSFHRVSGTEYHCLVMQFLGKSLEQRLGEREDKFSVKTVTQIAIKIINVIEYVHNCGIIHRDIKPDNFVFGDPEAGQDKNLFVIDFGLAKYWHENGKHIPWKANQMILGTPRYMSINSHRRISQSRRDDIEAIGYMLIYMLRGKLPWEGIKVKNREEQNSIILERKVSNTIESLVQGYPSVFGDFLTQARTLRFQEKPDYDGFRKMFLDFARSKKMKLNNRFDWDPRSGSSSSSSSTKKTKR